MEIIFPEKVEIGQIVAIVFQWIIVPLIMFSLFVISWVIKEKPVRDSENHISTSAGFWSGLVIFVLVVAYQLKSIRNPHFDLADLPDFSIISVTSGLVIGFGLLTVVKFVIPTRFAGFFVLLLSASSTIALFYYVFVDSLRNHIFYGTLSITLGVLLHIMIFPKSIHTFRKL